MASSSMKKKLEERKKKLAEKGGNFTTFSIKEGKTRFRHLPVVDEQEPAVEVITFFLGKDGGFIVSPASWSKKCAIMEAFTKMKNSKDPEDVKFSNKFKPRKKYLSPVIKYNDDKGKEVDHQSGVKLLQLAGGQYQDLIDLYLDDEQGDFTDPIEGYDIKHVRTGSGQMDTEYSMVPCKPSKLEKKYRGPYDPEAMAKELTLSYEETKEKIDAFLKIAPDEDDEDDDKPKKKKKKKSGKKGDI